MGLACKLLSKSSHEELEKTLNGSRPMSRLRHHRTVRGRKVAGRSSIANALHIVLEVSMRSRSSSLVLIWN